MSGQRLGERFNPALAGELAMREHVRCAYVALAAGGFSLDEAEALMRAEVAWRFTRRGRKTALVPTPGYENTKKSQSIEN